MLNRSLEILIGMLAILKIGAAYLPIDPTYPKHRINYILKDSNTTLLLTNSNAEHTINLDCKTINIELSNKKIYNTTNNHELSYNYDSSTISYIIYTYNKAYFIFI